MPDDDKKKKKKKRRYRLGRLQILIVLGALVYVLVTLADQQGQLVNATKRQEELSRQEAELKQQVEYYSNELDYIGTDEYVEQEARNRFGWLMPNEIKYMEGEEDTTKPVRDSLQPTPSPEPESTDSSSPQTGGEPSSESTGDPSGSPAPESTQSAGTADPQGTAGN